MSLFQQLYKSLYSPKDIARYRFQKIGKTIVYILLLSLLTLIPEILQLSNLVKTELSLAQQTLQEDVPDFTIEDGELKANITESVLKKENDFLFFFDPNVEEIPSSYTKDNGLFFLKHRLVLVSQGTSEAYEYSLLNDTVLIKADAEDFLSMLEDMHPLALLVFTVLLYTFDSFTAFFSITLLAFFGTAFAGPLKRRLNYKQTWTLTAYSFTIPTIFFMIMKFLNIAVSQSLLIFVFVVLVVLYLAIKEIPPAKERK